MTDVLIVVGACLVVTAGVFVGWCLAGPVQRRVNRKR